MQIHSKFLILHLNVVVNQNFVLSNIEECELHDRWLSKLLVVSIALSSVLHVADELIRNKIEVNDNSRFFVTYEPEL